MMTDISHIKLVCRLNDFMRLKPFVSSESYRYYLGGVHFRQGAEGVLLVATDGHRLGVFNAEEALCNGEGIVKLPTRLPKIDKHHVAWLVVGTFAGTDIALIMQFRGDAGAPEIAEVASLQNALAPYPRPLIDGVFPDWRKVVPSKISKPVGCFNSAYLADYASAAQSKKSASIAIYGEDLAAPYFVTVAGEKNFIGVQMPMRGDSLSDLPGWLQEPGTARQSKAA